MAIKKIVIIGPESTGKSTLSSALAEALNTVWVPEYAREYLEKLNRPYEEKDLLTIARGQLASEDRLMLKAKDYLFCDTDLHVIKVWSEHKYHRCHPEILEAISSRKYDFYLLTGIDIPWEYDPLREHAALEMREHFYNLYMQICKHTGVPYGAINGTAGERLQKALEQIKVPG